MTTEEGVRVALIGIPVLVVWLVVLIDIALQPVMRGRAKVLWAVLCTVFWPMLIVYWMTRPMQGRVELPEGRVDPHARLVEAALAHEAGRIDDDQLAGIVRDLRG